MFSLSSGSISLVLIHASSISFASISVVSLALNARMFASFHLLAPLAVSASTHSAARIPLILFAAMLTPVPV